jgi:alpha-L-arabinofuranosidase
MIQGRRRQSYERQAHHSPGFAACVGVLCILLNIPVFGQNRANVTIDLSKAVNVLTETSLGVPASTFDGNSFNLAGVPYLRAAGITAVRYPGNHGVADLYHWSTKTTTRYKGAESGYFAPESNFGAFAQFAAKLGQAVIIVNYGANFDGTGGGEPAEAAAWVAYANGDAADTRPIGKDSTGEDWHTVGYWAALRGQSPLASDDGLNFLRIQEPRPFGFKLWQIGDEVYNNGYYGGDHTSNPDLHASAPTGPKDFGKLRNDPKLSPSAYAENMKAFAQAMKAVDPSIQIGAAFTVPPSPDPNSHDWVTDWTRNVLKDAG